MPPFSACRKDGAFPSERQRGAPHGATSARPPFAAAFILGVLTEPQQGHVAAGRGDVSGAHALGREASDIVGPAGLRARAREALAAERLHTNGGPDLAAV